MNQQVKPLEGWESSSYGGRFTKQVPIGRSMTLSAEVVLLPSRSWTVFIQLSEWKPDTTPIPDDDVYLVFESTQGFDRYGEGLALAESALAKLEPIIRLGGRPCVEPKRP